MGTSKIKFKRKATTGAPTVTADRILESGEPFYNTAEKHLYVGNNGESIEDKKHIAQVTVTGDGDNCSVSIGEDDTNSVEFKKDTFKVNGKVISLDLSEVILDGGACGDDSD